MKHIKNFEPGQRIALIRRVENFPPGTIMYIISNGPKGVEAVTDNNEKLLITFKNIDAIITDERKEK